VIFNLDVVMQNVAPSLNAHYPADVTVLAGNEASFTVFVTDEGFPKNHVFQWFVNGVAVPGATEPSYVRDTSGDKGQLSVWCEVTNKAGTTTSRYATLTVKKVTSLDSRYPADSSPFVGEIATFYIATTEFGYPASYTCQWYVNGVAVPGATGTSFNHIRTTEGTDTVYCVVTNDAGSVQSRVATFTAQRIYLYYYGDTCNAVSGGWVAARSAPSSDDYINGLALNSNHIQLVSKENQYSAACASGYAIDLSRHTRLNAVAYTSDTSGRSALWVSTQVDSYDVNAVAILGLPTSEQVISLDISNITSGHIVFSADGTVTNSTAVLAVWLG
jgi:hypothetical protein